VPKVTDGLTKEKSLGEKKLSNGVAEIKLNSRSEILSET